MAVLVAAGRHGRRAAPIWKDCWATPTGFRPRPGPRRSTRPGCWPKARAIGNAPSGCTKKALALLAAARGSRGDRLVAQQSGGGRHQPGRSGAGAELARRAPVPGRSGGRHGRGRHGADGSRPDRPPRRRPRAGEDAVSPAAWSSSASLATNRAWRARSTTWAGWRSTWASSRRAHELLRRESGPAPPRRRPAGDRQHAQQPGRRREPPGRVRHRDGVLPRKSRPGPGGRASACTRPSLWRILPPSPGTPAMRGWLSTVIGRRCGFTAKWGTSRGLGRAWMGWLPSKSAVHELAAPSPGPKGPGRLNENTLKGAGKGPRLTAPPSGCR